MSHYSPALCKFINFHVVHKGDHQRLGQRFVNIYIKNNWPQLFYERDDGEAARMIDRWLSDNHYFDELPWDPAL